MKITFIGAGNMAGSMARGFYKAGVFAAEDITVTAKTQQTLDKFKVSIPGCKTTLNNAEAVVGADLIVIGVKPWLIEEVVAGIKDSIDYEHTTAIMSVVATWDTPKLAALFQKEGQTTPPLFYVIPNTAIDVMSSMTFYVPCAAPHETIQLVDEMFSKVGGVMQVTDKQMPACMALASCGIAYAFRYIRAAMEGGVEMGLYACDAKYIVSNTVKGAAEMLLQHNSHPEQEIDCVTTPGGLTIKGLNTMEENGFTNAVIQGLKAGR